MKFHHLVAGELVPRYEGFASIDDPDQTLGVCTAEPGSSSAQRLRLLASWFDSKRYQPRSGA